jgi:hypothetical protein
LPTGSVLATPRDAALYITKLPKAQHEAPEWQAAMQALILVAQHRKRPIGDGWRSGLEWVTVS